MAEAPREGVRGGRGGVTGARALPPLAVTMIEASMIALLAAIGALLLWALLWIVRFVVEVWRAGREERQREARRVTRVIPGLGEMSSTDGRWWSGQVRGIDVDIESAGGAPRETEVARVIMFVEEIDDLARAATEYLRGAAALDALSQPDDVIVPDGLVVGAGNGFRLDFGFSYDPDGFYWVRFVDRTPVEWGRDD